MSNFGKQISREINRVLDDLMERRQVLDADRITNQIVAAHRFAVSKHHRDDQLLMEWALRNAVRALVRTCMNHRVGNDDEGKPREQYLLPGYKHARFYYIVSREVVLDDGKKVMADVGVPITDMTDAEIEARADLHDQFAATNSAHGADLRRFLRERRAAAKAAVAAVTDIQPRLIH